MLFGTLQYKQLTFRYPPPTSLLYLMGSDVCLQIESSSNVDLLTWYYCGSVHYEVCH